jgi:TRAP-type C4-dicarboxylate transport system permease small subunit
MTENRSPFGRIEGFIGYLLPGLLMVSITFGVFAEIILRKMFDSSLFGLEEYVCLAMINITCLPIGTIQKDWAHVRMDLVVTMLKPKFSAILEILSLAISAAMFAVLIYGGAAYVNKLYNEGAITVLRAWPLWPAYLSVPLGSALLTIRLGIQIASRLKKYREGDYVSLIKHYD